MVVVVCFFCEFASAFGQNVYIVGGCPELGDWNPKKGRRMRYWWPWYVEVVMQMPTKPIEYKYVVQHDHVQQPPMWEDLGGPRVNRSFDVRGYNNTSWYIREVFNCIGTREVRGPERLEHLAITAEQIDSVQLEFGSLGERLETLRLDGQVAALPASLGLLRNLRALYLQFSPIESLPDAVGDLASLQLLDASACHLRSLPDSLGRLGCLRRLELSSNMLTALPEAIGAATALTELNASNNELKTIPASLALCTRLRMLRLGHNRLARIPPHLAAATALERLELQHNDIDWLPPELNALTRLEVLDVTDNPHLVALPAALFFRIGSDAAQCNYIAVVEPALQVKCPSLLDLCVTRLARLGDADPTEHRVKRTLASALSRYEQPHLREAQVQLEAARHARERAEAHRKVAATLSAASGSPISPHPAAPVNISPPSTGCSPLAPVAPPQRGITPLSITYPLTSDGTERLLRSHERTRGPQPQPEDDPPPSFQNDENAMRLLAEAGVTEVETDEEAAIERVRQGIAAAARQRAEEQAAMCHSDDEKQPRSGRSARKKGRALRSPDYSRPLIHVQPLPAQCQQMIERRAASPPQTPLYPSEVVVPLPLATVQAAAALGIVPPENAPIIMPPSVSPARASVDEGSRRAPNALPTASAAVEIPASPKGGNEGGPEAESESGSIEEAAEALDLAEDIAQALSAPPKRCDGCGRLVCGLPFVVELFHWAAFCPIGNANGVPLLSTYCTPSCAAAGRAKFAQYRPGGRYPLNSPGAASPHARAPSPELMMAMPAAGQSVSGGAGRREEGQGREQSTASLASTGGDEYVPSLSHSPIFSSFPSHEPPPLMTP